MEIGIEDSNRSLPDEVFEDLLEQITSKTLKVGDKIPSESQLCAQYNVSRVSARSAIQKLQAQNLVITKPGRGTFVLTNSTSDNVLSRSVGKMDLSQNEYRYVIELRKALEFTSIELMAEHGTEHDFQRLKHAWEEMKCKISDVDAYTKADYKFHMAIIEGSHNPLFKVVMNGCKDAVLKYFREMAEASENNEHAVHNHWRIYEALSERDADKAKQVIEGTFEFNLSRFKHAFKGD